jgi:2-methylcitrate dehydratase
MNSETKNNSILQKLATEVNDISFQDLSEDVINKAKGLIIDTIGCAFGAINSEVSQMVLEYVLSRGGKPQSTLIGTSLKTTPELACLYNGTLIRYLDSNDYYFSVDPAHPSGNLAAIWAAGQMQNKSGPEVILSLVIAYEIQMRLCDSAGNPSLWKRGWHHSTNASFSSSAAVAKLIGCSALEIAHAMAITGSHQNTLAQLQSGNVSLMKATAEAWVAKCGLEGASLAKLGLTGPLNLIEGDFGWSKSVCGVVNYESLLNKSQPFKLLESNTKPFPAVASAIAPIACAIHLFEKNLSYENIYLINIFLPKFVLDTPATGENRRYPNNSEMAQHSLYYCVAASLVRGFCNETIFSKSNLYDLQILEVIKKIRLVEDSSLSHLWPLSAGGGIEILFQNREKLSHKMEYPLGHSKNSVSKEQQYKKFYDYTFPVLGKNKTIELYDSLDSLDSCTDINSLSVLLSP